MTTCATENVCYDLESEINLDKVWNRIKTNNTTKEFCQTFAEVMDGDESDEKKLKKSTCPFSSRIDIQYYFYKKHNHNSAIIEDDDKEQCIDRFGRKYFPFGGKCAMFQHEFQKEDGKTITEFFMPIEKIYIKV